MQLYSKAIVSFFDKWTTDNGRKDSSKENFHWLQKSFLPDPGWIKISFNIEIMMEKGSRRVLVNKLLSICCSMFAK